jgi:hypothetical protein
MYLACIPFSNSSSCCRIAENIRVHGHLSSLQSSCRSCCSQRSNSKVKHCHMSSLTPFLQASKQQPAAAAAA